MSTVIVQTEPGTEVVVLPRRPAVGVQFHGLWDHYWVDGEPTAAWHQHFDGIVAAGVRTIRVDFGWSTAMPTNVWNPNQYYVKRLDRLLTRAAADGVEVLVTVHQSPGWARPGTTGDVKQYPTDLTAWRTFCQNMAALFTTRVYAWEVWNEPNLSQFTGVVTSDPNVKADRYFPILKAAAEGLRAGHPAAKVMFGGPSQTDATFIDACYWRGAKDYFDIMAVHPYLGNQTKSPLATDLFDKSRPTYMPALLEDMAYWDRLPFGKEIWWSEVGVSVHSNDGISDVFRYGVPTDEQAAESFRQYLQLAAQYPQVSRVIFYAAHRVTSDIHQAGYSIMNNDGTPKAQLDAISDYLRGEA